MGAITAHECQPAGCEDTRERILLASQKLFAEKGFDATSVRDITTEAKCNVASVNYHFGGKENLYLETFRSMLTILRDRRLELMAELMERGEKAYNTSCAACHQTNGEGVPGAFPALKGGKITTGPRSGHLDIVMNGKPGTAMAAFAGQLSDIDMAAVVTYERNAWGNDTGDMVQPSEVKAAR